MRDFALDVLDIWFSILCWIVLLGVYLLPLWLILGGLGWLATR